MALAPARVLTQVIPDGRWIVSQELCGEDIGITSFADSVLQVSRSPGIPLPRLLVQPRSLRGMRSVRLCTIGAHLSLIPTIPRAPNFAGTIDANRSGIGHVIMNP